MLGRMLGGVATSILLTAFESWMIFEHNRHGFPDEWLSKTFSLATFGNGFCAVFAGLLAFIASDGFDHNRRWPDTEKFGLNFASQSAPLTYHIMSCFWGDNAPN